MIKKDELLKIEQEIKELEQRKKNILNEVKKKESEEIKRRNERKKEVENAYNEFVKLLEAYEKDFGGGYKVSLTGSFSM